MTGLLEADGVDYFCLPHTDPRRSAVAVAAEHRAQVLRLLRGRAAEDTVIRTLDVAGRRVSPQRCAVVQVYRSAGARRTCRSPWTRTPARSSSGRP
ncbi:hypothetical protein ACFQZ4_15790 [Catellatospora coxensis]